MTSPAPAVTIAAADADTLDVQALQRLWLKVTEAGGAVGLRAPVTLHDTRPLVDDLLRRARTPDTDLIAAHHNDGGHHDGDDVIGLVALHRDTAARREHRATLRRLMVHPAHQRAGIGTDLMARAHQLARQRGIELILVELRDGLGLERFYERLGYRACARIPDGLSFGDDRVDELLYVADLRGNR